MALLLCIQIILQTAWLFIKFQLSARLKFLNMSSQIYELIPSRTDFMINESSTAALCGPIKSELVHQNSLLGHDHVLGPVSLSAPPLGNNTENSVSREDEKHLAKPLSDPVPKELLSDDDIEIQELDNLIKKTCLYIDSIDININLPSVKDVLDLITQKSGIVQLDKNLADVNAVSALLDDKIHSLARLKLEKDSHFQNLQRIQEENQSKLSKAMLELQETQKELELLKISQGNAEKITKEYQNIFTELGITIQKVQNSYEIESNATKIIFELSSQKKYTIKSNNAAFIYKNPQSVYPSELSYILHRLLIN
jgi:hypothetical protein